MQPVSHKIEIHPHTLFNDIAGIGILGSYMQQLALQLLLLDIKDRHEQILFILEMAIDRSLAQSGADGDIIESRSMITLRREHLHCGVHDGFMVLFKCSISCFTFIMTVHASVRPAL